MYMWTRAGLEQTRLNRGAMPERPRFEREIAALGLREVDFEERIGSNAGPKTVKDLTNDLTNLVFFARHPKLKGQKLAKGTELAEQWRIIKDDEVVPALHHASTEFRIAQLIFFARHPEIKGRFTRLPQTDQAKFRKIFQDVRTKEVTPVAAVQIARGPVKSRTLFVVNDKPFNGLPASVRTAAGAQIADVFSFVGKKEPNAPMTVIFLAPNQFPEAYNFSDAVVHVVDSHPTIHINAALRRQTANARHSISKLGLRVSTELSGRFPEKPERYGVAAANKQVVAGATGTTLAIPLMAAAIDLGAVVSDFKEEIKEAKIIKEALPDDIANWNPGARAILGKALGRAIAHEARHLYLTNHASDDGLGMDEPQLVSNPKHERFSAADQVDILNAIKQLEAKQGEARVVETFPQGREFPF